jgi:hypothetical protein
MERISLLLMVPEEFSAGFDAEEEFRLKGI